MRYLRLFTIIALLSLFPNCEKDAKVQPKEYLYVITNSPIVNSKGAEFSADITNIGNQEILKYGFILSNQSNPTIQDYSILFDGKVNEGIYTCNVNSGLVEGKTYYVRAYILTLQYEVYGNVKSFCSQGSFPPIIDDFDPKFGPIGTEVVIKGENFSPFENSNIVKFGSVETIVDSFSENKIVVTIPQINKPETVQITIKTAGMTASSQDSFDLWYPWKRLNDFNAGYAVDYPISFTVNNKGYFGLGYSKTNFWEYDPVKDLFIEKADFPKSIRAYPISFTANNIGYVLFIDDCYSTAGGMVVKDTINELWEYNPENDSWTRKADFPGSKRSYGVAFSINEKGYIVGGKYWDYSYAYYPKDLWEYDPLRDEWTQKADFPGPDCARSFGFSMNGKGFIGMGSPNRRSIYEYNPTSDSWSYFTDYPGDGYNFINGFVINNKCYLGLGRNNSYDSYSDFWELNFENKSWEKLHSCPINMRANLSFTIKNKGYIGVGWNDYHDYSNILFEFDPAKD